MLKSTLLIFTILLGLLSINACKNADNKTTGNVVGTGGSLPNLPAELFDKMQKETSLVDMIPYTTKISLSIDDRESIQSFVLNYLKNSPVTVGLNCTQPEGRLFFSNLQGSTYLEADLFFNNQCKYLVYYDAGGKTPLYATQIIGEGLDYFTKMYSAKPVEGLKQIQENK